MLDTQVYSNTGGQASKATPRGAVAKFAAAGKSSGRKDLGAIARAYGNVYVAQIALGASDTQTNKAMLEAEAWPGPSIIIAYSTCIAHGIDMSTSMTHQKDAVKSGFWPLYRYMPSEAADGQPFKLDSKAADDADQGVRRVGDALRHPARARSLSGPPSWRRSRRPTPTSAGATTASWPTSSAASRTWSTSPAAAPADGPAASTNGKGESK